jgi:hypothetical protein
MERQIKTIASAISASYDAALSTAACLLALEYGEICFSTLRLALFRQATQTSDVRLGCICMGDCNRLYCRFFCRIQHKASFLPVDRASRTFQPHTGPCSMGQRGKFYPNTMRHGEMYFANR